MHCGSPCKWIHMHAPDVGSGHARDASSKLQGKATARFVEMRFAVKRIASQWRQEQLGQQVAGRTEIESDQFHTWNDQSEILR